VYIVGRSNGMQGVHSKLKQWNAGAYILGRSNGMQGVHRVRKGYLANKKGSVQGAYKAHKDGRWY